MFAPITPDAPHRITHVDQSVRELRSYQVPYQPKGYEQTESQHWPVIRVLATDADDASHKAHTVVQVPVGMPMRVERMRAAV